MIVIDQHLSAVHFNGKDDGGSNPSLSAPVCRMHRKHQRGAIGVMFGVMTIVLLGFTGVALSVSMVYNRKAELQAVADNAALAAARVCLFFCGFDLFSERQLRRFYQV